MYRVLLLVVSYFAYGCTSASLPMMGADTTRLAIGGHDFVVRHTDQRAEVVRANPAVAARSDMLALSKLAMEQASGCKVRDGTLYGDAVLAEAMLACPAAPSARLLPVWTFDDRQ
ncbi:MULTISPECIES: hypothetical protein [unclassified Meridianimarinicoccus]|uniref:hypothetical protein n=1 Tax=unclassified Meridianimarinicoccus TaxID=2923344 RepID=UPI0018683888|nr:hypothetical protein [Fluviibacterium sp. MJW13]